jgi:hypothetical protein
LEDYLSAAIIAPRAICRKRSSGGFSLPLCSRLKPATTSIM